MLVNGGLYHAAATDHTHHPLAPSHLTLPCTPSFSPLHCSISTNTYPFLTHQTSLLRHSLFLVSLIPHFHLPFPYLGVQSSPVCPFLTLFFSTTLLSLSHVPLPFTPSLPLVFFTLNLQLQSSPHRTNSTPADSVQTLNIPPYPMHQTHIHFCGSSSSTINLTHPPNTASHF